MAALFVGESAKPPVTDTRNAVMFEEGLIALSSFMGVDVSGVCPCFTYFSVILTGVGVGTYVF